MSSARKRKKTGWLPYTGALTSLRYDKRIDRLIRAGQLWGVTGYQVPVKYNRCKHCGGGRHCAPDLVERKMRLGVTGKPLA